MSNSRRTPKEIRSSHNRELIQRMQTGEALNSFDSQASWFPPRPVIEKDGKEVKRLYGSIPDSQKVALPRSVLDLADHLTPVAPMPRDGEKRRKA